MRRKISFSWGAPIYVFLFLYALIMTQLLRSTISAVFFWFIVIVLPLSFLLMIITKALIQVYVFADKNQTEKYSPVEYEIRVINQSPIPCPFVEALISQPSTDAVKTLEERLFLSLIPFGGYSVKRTVSFKFRGLYEIGVKELYVTDILHIFRIRADIDNYSNVTVAARRLPLHGASERAVSDLPSPVSRVIDTRDMSEVANIRDYRIGDPLRSIHWKLSAKSEEMLVRDYSTNNDRHTYIFVDMSEPTTPPELTKEAEKKHSFVSIKDRDLKGALARTTRGGAAVAKVTLSEKFSFISEWRERRAERKRTKKYNKRRAKGVSRRDIDTIDAIDELIRATSSDAKKKEIRDEKEKRRLEIKDRADAVIEKARDEKELEGDVLEKLRGIIGDDTRGQKEKRDDDILRRWGGAVLPEYRDSYVEMVSDNVAEIAISAILRELRAGNRCTVVRYLSDNDADVSYEELCDMQDFENIYTKFASAPSVSDSCRVSSLTDIIGEAQNVTVRIVTGNIDPKAISEYCTVPAKFGGAGTGCVTEILLTNPYDKYTSPKERLEYVEEAKLRLKQFGITVTEVVESVANDGSAIFTSTDLLS